MRILAAADIHGDVQMAKRLADEAERENVDLVVLAGDLFRSDFDTENIVGPFRAKNKKIILLPGNHEAISTTNFVAQKYDAVNLHGYSVKDGNVGLFGCSADNLGVDRLSDTEVERMLKQAFNYVRDSEKKVMVTHVHPAHTKMAELGLFVSGSRAVENMIKELKPDIFICGHAHEASGIEEKIGNTRVINVSRIGKIIDL